MSTSTETYIANMFVQNNHRVIDIGARKGVISWMLLNRVGRDGELYIFEPFSLNVKTLTSIFNKYKNVCVHALALSDKTGRSNIYIPKTIGGLLTAEGTMENSHNFKEYIVEKVNMTTLDEIFLKKETKIDFIKCDVEGHEFKVLSGGKKLIEKSNPIILVEIEERHNETSLEKTKDLMKTLDYSIYFTIDQKSFLHINMFQPDKHQNLMFLGTKKYCNLFLCLPNNKKEQIKKKFKNFYTEEAY